MEKTKIVRVVFDDNNYIKTIIGELILETDFVIEIIGSKKNDKIVIGKRALIKMEVL